jgi:hypothetical protein
MLLSVFVVLFHYVLHVNAVQSGSHELRVKAIMNCRMNILQHIQLIGQHRAAPTIISGE